MIVLNFFSSCKDKSFDGLVGYYVNNNYDENTFLAEIPYIKDTLQLKNDGTFSSIFYGSGNYVLLNNELHLKSIGSNYGTRILPIEKIYEDNSFRLVLSSDLNYCYKKIDSLR